MPINLNLRLKPGAALFLLPHRDDEFGVFPQIAAHLRARQDVICAYFTQNHQTAYDQKRNRESLSVLQKLGVPKGNVLFPSYELGLFDLHLTQKIAEIAEWLEKLLTENPNISRIYVPAWEGGHPDHDVLHGVIVGIMERRKQIDLIRQFPLYNNYNCPGPFYRVHAPLVANGTVEKLPIAWADRWRFLTYCLHYPSQAITFIGLFPFSFIHYLFYGVQYLQSVSPERTKTPPHAQPLYYEKRRFSSYAIVAKELQKWRESMSS